MRYLRVNSCFGFIDLKTGCLLIGCVGLLASGFIFFFTEKIDAGKGGVLPFLIEAVCVLNALCAIPLLFGVSKGKADYLIPFMALCLIDCAFGLGIFIFSCIITVTTEDKKAEGIVILLLTAVLTSVIGKSFLVVKSYHSLLIGDTETLQNCVMNRKSSQMT